MIKRILALIIALTITVCVPFTCFAQEEKEQPTEHSFKEEVIAATCTNVGTEKKICTVHENCSENVEKVIPALGHNFTEEKENVASTCNSVGYVTKKCSRCDETETTYSSTLGAHEWGAWETVQTVDETHPGIKVRQCSVCKLYEYGYTAPTGEHNWNEGVVTTKATCTTEGEKTYTCIADGNCACTADNKATYTEKLPAIGHTAKVDVKEAACTEDGYVKAVCETCKTTLDEKTLEKKEHAEKVTITDPTCTTPGSKVYTCAVCGETTKQTEEIPVVSHAYEVTDEFVNATCTSPKYQKYACKYCGEEKLVKVGEATGHKVAETEITEATHTAAGSVRKYCSCGQLMDVEIIQPSHKFEWKTVEAATCSKEGIEKQICSVCKAEGETKTIEKLAHRFEWRVIEDATCAAEGSRKQVCTVCKAEGKIESIAKTAHNYEWITVKEATCKENGSRKQVCTVCKTVGSTSVIPKTKNHDYEWKTEKAATCKEEGSRIQVCSVCGAKGESETLSKTAHNYKWKTVKEATCKNKGSRKQVCTVCKAVGKTETTKKTAHKWSTSSSKCTVCEEKDVAKRIISAKCNPSVYYVGDTWQSEMIMEVEYRYHTACIRSTIKPSTFSTNKPNSISVKLQSGDLISKPIKITVNKAQKPTVKTKKNSATVLWKKVNGAEGYVVKVYKGSKLIGTKNIESGSTTSCSFKKLAKSTNYKFVVQYKRGGMTQTSKFTTTAKTKAK